jgi:hypothetical protein
VVGLRSRATGVARLEAVAARARLFCALVEVLWTCDAGRAGAHPYLAKDVCTFQDLTIDLITVHTMFCMKALAQMVSAK